MTVTTPPGPRTPVWAELRAQAARLATCPVAELFERDPRRFERFSREQAGLLMDLSRQRLDEIALAKLLQLADAVGLRARIDAMWRGEHINATEDRAVLHVALRQPPGAGIGGAEIEKTVMTERAPHAGVRRRRAQRRHRRQHRAAVPAGGQHRHRRLGPGPRHGGAGAARLHRRRAALRVRIERRRRATWRKCCESADPATTLFIVSSKTFTTLETLTNARTARAWLAERNGEAAVPPHFAAVSVNTEAMDAFGVHPEYRFQMWDWVGGRYSMWSSIGVSLAIAIGARNFLRLPRRRPRDGRALPHCAVGREPAGADGAARRLEHQFPAACRRSRCCPTMTRCGASRPICSSSRWRATASP